jgi:hypothetical protein
LSPSEKLRKLKLPGFSRSVDGKLSFQVSMNIGIPFEDILKEIDEASLRESQRLVEAELKRRAMVS